jgi:anti-sigma factor RsiW
MAIEELTCKELVELVTDYLEGTLPASERERFERHLADCDGCTNYLAQMHRTIRLVGKLSEDSLEETSKAKLLQVFRDWKKQ